MGDTLSPPHTSLPLGGQRGPSGPSTTIVFCETGDNQAALELTTQIIPAFSGARAGWLGTSLTTRQE